MAHSEPHNRQLAFMLDTESEYWQNIECHCDRPKLLGNRESWPERYDRTKPLLGCGCSLNAHGRGRRVGTRDGNPSPMRRINRSTLSDLHPQEQRTGSRLMLFCPARPRECRGVAQPGSALALGARGPRFESGRPDHKAPFVNSVEPHRLRGDSNFEARGRVIASLVETRRIPRITTGLLNAGFLGGSKQAGALKTSLGGTTSKSIKHESFFKPS
jgi:hypothetical protein